MESDDLGECFMRSFFGLALTRTSIAICQAGCSPASNSLIRLFPHAAAVWLFHYFLVSRLEFGWGCRWAYHQRPLRWRTAFIVLGAPGVALAILIRLVLREPPRGRFENHPETDRTYKIGEAMAEFWKRRSFWQRHSAWLFCVLAARRWKSGLQSG